MVSVRFNETIEKYNILSAPTEYIATFFEKQPAAYKIALIINHLFRAAMMVGIMFIPQIPLAASMSICFVGSLFYRLTVERNCAYKFALPAFFGAAAFMLALPAIIGMINGTAFATIGSGFQAFGSLVPLALYGAYIILTVNYEVNKTLERLNSKKPCCSVQEEPIESH
jgi:hypothetical protein